jgi:hypothetical protein
MMPKRYFIFFIIIIGSISLSLLATSAQARWSIWVYQAESGRLLRVDNQGSVIATQDIAASAQNLVIAPNGDKAAYLISSRQLIVKDLNNGSQIAAIGLSEIGIPHDEHDRLLLYQAAFDESSNNLVYAEILGGLGWQIHLYDLNSAMIRYTLRYRDAMASNFPTLHAGIIPQIQSIYGDTITFNVDPRLPIGIHSYHWFYRGAILSETVAAPNFESAYFPYSGDIVNPLADNRFPAENEDFRFDFEQHNSLHAYVLANGRFPFFFDPELDLEQVWFIQAGERLLVQAYVDEIRHVWIILGRDGNEIRRQPVAGTDIVGTPDGFVYATRVENQTAIVEVDTRTLANAGETLWLQPGIWRIVWAGQNQPENTLPAWTQLGDVQVDPSGSASPDTTPTLAPPPNAFRRVGMAIQIFVPDEGYLNLRDAPSSNSNVVTLLESGSRGTIISGPVTAEGFIWWEITVDNRSGWVVESLPDSLALIPPQLIATRTPTPSPTP